jgi:hypothetical protein
MHELEAAMITISQTGLGVEQTNTLITNVFHKLLNPTEELKQHYNDLGVSTGEMYVKQLGLVGVLEDMIKTPAGPPRRCRNSSTRSAANRVSPSSPPESMS